MWAKKKIAMLDEWFPPCGPCECCGSRDARHRVWDSIMERFEAGEAINSIALDLRLSPKAIQIVLLIRPYKKRSLYIGIWPGKN